MEDSTKIGGRGASWKPDETRCLIAIWGEETVQMQLSKNHRNICVYDKIASQLRKHGFNRSAGECRTKAKALKRGYKKAVQLSKTSGMGAIDFPFFSELQDVFAGDASIEAKRAAGGNALRFEKKTDTPEMPPDTRVLSSTPNASSEDLFTHEAVQEHFVLNLTSVQEEDEDMTQIGSEVEDVGQTGESVMEQHITLDGEQDGTEFPNLQPVQPSETYSARQKASLTPAERIALIKRKHDKSNFELLGREMMESSRKNMESLLNNSNEHFREEMQWKKLYLEETRSNFKELIGVLKDFTNTYKEDCARRESKPVRVVRRVKKKGGDSGSSKDQSPSPIDSDSVQIDTSSSQCSQEQCSNPVPSNDLQIYRKFRAPRVIKKPVPFSP